MNYFALILPKLVSFLILLSVGYPCWAENDIRNIYRPGCIFAAGAVWFIYRIYLGTPSCG